MTDRILRGVKFSAMLTLRKLWTVRCVCCGAVPNTASNVMLPASKRRAVGADVVVTCGSHYCRHRAETGEVSLRCRR